MDERIPGLLERPEMCASFVTPHLIYSIYKYIDNIKLYNQGDCSYFLAPTPFFFPLLLERHEMCASFLTPQFIYYICK